jgi:hypothetical protein
LGVGWKLEVHSSNDSTPGSVEEGFGGFEIQSNFLKHAAMVRFEKGPPVIVKKLGTQQLHSGQGCGQEFHRVELNAF